MKIRWTWNSLLDLRQVVIAQVLTRVGLIIKPLGDIRDQRRARSADQVQVPTFLHLNEFGDVRQL